MNGKKYYNPNNFNAVHAGAAYLAYWAVRFLALFAVTAVFSRRTAVDAGLFYSLETAAVALGLTVLIVVLCAVAGSKPMNGGGFLARRGCGMECLMAIVLMFGVSALLAPLGRALENAGAAFGAVLPDIDLPVPALSEGGREWRFVFLFLLVPVLPAILDELLFLGVIMRGLLQYGKVPAAVISSLLYALAYAPYHQTVVRFLAALAVAWLVLETKNLFVGMAANFACGFFAAWGKIPEAVIRSQGDTPEAYLAVISIMAALIGCVCAVAGVLYFGRRMLHMQRAPEHSRGDIRAAFVEEDPVSGTQIAECPWYACGELSPAAEPRRVYLSGNSRRRMNAEAKLRPAAILLTAGLLLGTAMFILSFYFV